MQSNSNNTLFQLNKNLIKLYLFLLFIFSVFRSIFLLYFSEPGFITLNISELLTAFIFGLRYDTIAISFVLLPLFFLSVIISILKSLRAFTIYSKFSRVYSLFCSIVYITILSGDIGFYSYFQDHINILVFGFFEDDTTALLQTFWNNYPVIIASIIAAVVCLSLWMIIKRLIKTETKSLLKPSVVGFLVQCCLMLFLFAGATRGGYSKLVLSPKYSDFSSNEFINQIAYNGVLSLEKAYKVRSTNTRKDFKLEDSLGYKNNISGAISDYIGENTNSSLEAALTRKTQSNEKVAKTKPHVIVFLMESFGASWLDYQSDEFNFLGELEEHISSDLFSSSMISTGRGTIGSLVGILTNNPRRPGRRFLSESRYLASPLKSAMQLPYKRAGYNTQFLYGGKLSWRNIGKYAKTQGFDELVGEGQIRASLNLKGEQGTEWGLYDEHLYSYIKLSLEKATKPQFIFVLTTTNHPPFKYPNTYKKPKLTISKRLDKQILRERGLFNKRFETFRYTNDKLGNFISYVKNSKTLAAKTIISFTGDHNFWGFKNYSKDQAYLKFTVPFYIYLPKQLQEKKKYQLNPIAGHEDIMTTLYNLSLSNAKYISFGDDMLSSNSRTNAIGPGIYADKTGVMYKNNFYKWSSFPLIDTKARPVEKKNTIFYRSLLSVSDYFIRLQDSE